MNEYTGRLFKFKETEKISSEIMELFDKTTEFHEKFPEILKSIDVDLDNHGLKKKVLRIEKKRYVDNLKNDSAWLLSPEDTEGVLELKLQEGRRRMKPEIVFFFMTLRGLWGSVSDYSSSERIYDSRTIHMILSDLGHSQPGINTIRENLNAVSNKTRELILECQISHIISECLDDFEKVYVDSTEVEGNTAYPTDVSTLYKLIKRASKIFSGLKKFGLPECSDSWTQTRIEKMKGHLNSMSMLAGKPASKGKVKENFKQFSALAAKVIDTFLLEQERIQPYWENVELPPGTRRALDKLWFKIDDDLYDAINVLYYADLSINQEVKIPSREKILSIADRDVAFIKKGQRNPTIGYKPQLAKSQNGFICGYINPIGNASDSEMLVPMIRKVISTTGIIPTAVSTDDGYTSAENLKILKNDLGIRRVSFSGSKGKKLTIADWDTACYVESRRMRSSIESLMFTIKFSHKFGRLRRRGIDAVNAEQLEKILSYNFIKIIRKEKERPIKEMAS